MVYMTLIKKLSFVTLLNNNGDKYNNAESIKQLGLDKCKKLKVLSILPQKETVSDLYREGFSTENIKTIVTNVFEEIIGKISNYVSAYIKDQLICVMYDYEFEENDFEEKINSALDVIKKHFGLKIAIGIGQDVQNAEDINVSYASSNEALAFMKFYGIEGCMFFEDLQTTGADIDFINKIYRELENVLKYNSDEKIGDCIDNIIKYYRKNNISVCKLKRDILSLVLNIERIHLAGNKDLSRQYDADYSEINNAEFFEEFKQSICNHLSFVQSLKTKEDKNGSFKSQIICKYIDEHYTNPELTNVMIADYFSMNPSYLSRMFKKSYFINIKEYIDKLRIEKAKNMIVTTVKNMDDIAEECGFTNVYTFMRIFKKHTGSTPGNFRNMNL